MRLATADRFQWAWSTAGWTDGQPSAIRIRRRDRQAAMVTGWRGRGFRPLRTGRMRRGKRRGPVVPKGQSTHLCFTVCPGAERCRPQPGGGAEGFGIHEGRAAAGGPMLRLLPPLSCALPGTKQRSTRAPPAGPSRRRRRGQRSKSSPTVVSVGAHIAAKRGCLSEPALARTFQHTIGLAPGRLRQEGRQPERRGGDRATGGTVGG